MLPSKRLIEQDDLHKSQISRWGTRISIQSSHSGQLKSWRWFNVQWRLYMFWTANLCFTEVWRNSEAGGNDAASKELIQLHDRKCFTPRNIAEITPSERRKAMDALILLTEKNGTIKGRMAYNGKGTCEWVSKDDAASPTAYAEIIMIARVLDAKEDRDVMTGDVPNAYTSKHF